jgi:peroxisomal 3,2-trans-enoyl-CoA isomerase
MVRDHGICDQVMGLNGAAVGGGAAWFMGAADLIYASEAGYLQVSGSFLSRVSKLTRQSRIQVPFGELGLVPEGGSGVMFPENMGLRRAMGAFLLLSLSCGPFHS